MRRKIYILRLDQTKSVLVWISVNSVNCVCTFSGDSVTFTSVVCPFPEPRVGLGIGACCLALENSPPGIYIHSLAPGSVAKMESNLRFVTSLAYKNPPPHIQSWCGLELWRHALLFASTQTGTERETYNPGWLWTYYIAKDNLKLLISCLYLPNAKL